MGIIGYSYRASIYCAGCINDALDTGPGGNFDGWYLVPGAPRMSTEENLSEIAAAFGIDRDDERTFDSDYFPKVILSLQAEGVEHCEECGSEL